ncbi:flavin reductase [Actinomadura namibiensis]|uniref:Flavin reductase (DIM6/NTAB) family NADH-FMN oxidoreductase RutF n=1 Tax=Actinomadura namibiensis TaxID=182080 RepID=A0A7W3QRQ6_ACTNM|nr:flavin reductase [Actinomadura namibiensis]MBA8956862.1 flavin reductase (DIM6/NTAB) family NADH-FMN oxidoreductase RutF [Actinomadura namibiensis]
MTVDAETFRAVLGQWPTGVCVVTTVADGAWHGMTASSFSSVSLDPPLVLVCLDRRLRTHRLVESCGAFAVSVLGRDHARLGRVFAGLEPGERFAGHPWRTARTGAPVLEKALGWLDCRVAHAYPGGDHTIFVGEVLAGATPRRAAPLLFHSRAWGQLADPLPDEVSVSDTGLAAALHRRSRPSGTAPARIAPAEAARLLETVRAAGVRTRVHPADPPPDPGPRGSVLVSGPAQVRSLPRGAAGAVEFHDDRHAPGIVAAAAGRGLRTVGRVADAFAAAREAAALAAVERLRELGCDEIALDEGPDAASPLRVRRLLQNAVAATRPVPLRVRLREAYGLGLANALTAMKSGVRHFDATLGGVDGGLCAEDVLFLAERLEVRTPVDRSALVAAAAALEAVWGGPLPGRTYRTAS